MKGRKRKISPEQVLEILAARAAGAKLETLAFEYGVSTTVIWRIVKSGGTCYRSERDAATAA